MDNVKKRRITVNLILLVILVVISITAVVKILELNKINKEKQYLEELLRQTPGPTLEATEETTQTPEPTPEATPEVTETPSPTPEPTETEDVRVINERIIELRRELKNNNIVGYITIPNTTVSYPVVQYSDNEYYLNRDIDRVKTVAGSIFVDYENDFLQDDPNTIIYGHNMKADYMFHALRNYSSKEFYENDDHKYIILHTLTGTTVWEIYAFFRAPVTFNYIQVNFPSTEKYFEMVQGILKLAQYDTGIELTPEDRILTLSTCTGGDSDYRNAVSARLITDPELIPVDLLEKYGEY